MQENLNEAWKIIVEHWLLILTISTTVLTAMMRTAKHHGKIDYLEAGLCTMFSLSLWFTLEYLGLPKEVGVAVGVFVAYIGTVRFSAWVRSKLGIE